MIPASELHTTAHELRIGDVFRVPNPWDDIVAEPMVVADVVRGPGTAVVVTITNPLDHGVRLSKDSQVVLIHRPVDPAAPELVPAALLQNALANLEAAREQHRGALSVVDVQREQLALLAGRLDECHRSVPAGIRTDGDGTPGHGAACSVASLASLYDRYQEENGRMRRRLHRVEPRASAMGVDPAFFRRVADVCRSDLPSAVRSRVATNWQEYLDLLVTAQIARCEKRYENAGRYEELAEERLDVIRRDIPPGF